ncbi:MAG: hypothetical protein HDS22_07115 [Bacteroides sp.]|nr:hypothetical protein [Bacteroides sp.]
MRLLPLLISQSVLILAGSAPFQSRDLNRMADYISEKEGAEGIIWEVGLSEEPVEDGSRVALYGDTLYSETLGGTRRWYHLKNDTLFHTREETLTEAVTVCPGVPSGALGGGNHTGETPYRATGASSASVRIIREGSHWGMSEKKGFITIFPGDTVRAFMTTERFRYHESNSVCVNSGYDIEYTSGEGDATVETGKRTAHDVEIRRWFTDLPLPYAVSMRHVYYGDDGVESYYEECIYVSERGSVENIEQTEDMSAEKMQDIVRNVLSELTMNENGGVLSLTFNTPYPLKLSLDIFTDSGIPCLHEDFVADGIGTLTFPCTSVPMGRRLIVISGYGLSERRYVRFH